MTTTIPARVITILKSWFTQHGIPISVMSDNDSPFNIDSFKEFSEEWNFNHITFSPNHPQSKEIVENAVKTSKSLLKASDDKQEPLFSILHWRSTPALLLYGKLT